MTTSEKNLLSEEKLVAAPSFLFCDNYTMNYAPRSIALVVPIFEGEKIALLGF